MATSNSTGRAWIDLIRRRRQDFIDYGYRIPEAVTDEDSFRTYFEDICRPLREYYYTILLSKMRTGAISDFANTVDSVMGLEAPESVGSMVLGGLIMAFQCGIDYGESPRVVTDILGEYNSAVSNLNVDISPFVYHSRIQESLRRIVDVYMGFMIEIISAFGQSARNGKGKGRSISIKGILENSAAQLENEEAEFQKYIHQATMAQKYEAGVLSPNGFNDRAYNDDNDEHTRGQFQRVRTLGKGSFGHVDEVRELSTGEVFACKRILLVDHPSSPLKREDEVNNEFQIMKKLSHQHITQVLFWVKEQSFYSIFMRPVADCDLRVYLELCFDKNAPRERKEIIISWFGCLLDGLAYAHRLNVMHRDIKPSNILIKGTQVYLADFGLAKDYTIDEASKDPNYYLYGTPVYRAPEVKFDTPRGLQSDVFSLGCVFSEMLTVRRNRTLESFQTHRQINTEDGHSYAFRDNLEQVITWINKFRDDRVIVLQIQAMLLREPYYRPSADEARKNLQTDVNWRSYFCQYH